MIEQNEKNKEIIENEVTSIHFLDYIIRDSLQYNIVDKTFSIFTSIDNVIYLTYSTRNNSIIFFNLLNNQKKSEIKNAHNKTIINIIHYFDKIYKRDLIMSVSCEDSNIKIWSIKTIVCIFDLKNIYENGSILSACFLYDNNQN